MNNNTKAFLLASIFFLCASCLTFAASFYDCRISAGSLSPEDLVPPPIGE